MGSLKKSLNILYDAVTACISVADVTTDVWIAYRFYVSGRMTFFWISTVVMILAQIAYTIAFTLRFSPSSMSIRRTICVLFCALPLAPVMSFIFYWASRPNNCVSSVLRNFGLSPDEMAASNENEPQITKWIKEKFEKVYHDVLYFTISIVHCPILSNL